MAKALVEWAAGAVYLSSMRAVPGTACASTEVDADLCVVPRAAAAELLVSASTLEEFCRGASAMACADVVTDVRTNALSDVKRGVLNGISVRLLAVAGVVIFAVEVMTVWEFVMSNPLDCCAEFDRWPPCRLLY